MISRHTLVSFLVMATGFFAGWFLVREGIIPVPETGAMETALENGPLPSGAIPSGAFPATVISMFLLLFLAGIPGFFRDRAYRRFAATLIYDTLVRPRQLSSLHAYHGTGWVVLLLLGTYLAGLAVITGAGSPGLFIVLAVLTLLPVLLLYVTDRPGLRPGRFFLSLLAPKAQVMLGGLLLLPYPGSPSAWLAASGSGIPAEIPVAVVTMLVFRKVQLHAGLVRRWGELRAITAFGRICLAGSVQAGFSALLLRAPGPGFLTEAIPETFLPSLIGSRMWQTLPVQLLAVALALAFLSGVLHLSGRFGKG